MTTIDKTGGPAFPLPELNHWDGMTLRDYFAGQALAGLAAHYGTPDGAEILAMPERSYIIADAMLKIRGRTP